MTQEKVVLPLPDPRWVSICPKTRFSLACWKGARREMRPTGTQDGEEGARGWGPHSCYLATVMGQCRLVEAVPAQRTDHPRRGTHGGTSMGCSVLKPGRDLHRAKGPSAHRGTCVRPCPHSWARAASPGRELCPVVFAGDVCTRIEQRPW